MRAAWLEPHDQFDGVGAHEFNRRYDWVDEGEHDYSVIPAADTTPALIAARTFLATATVPVRFDGADISHYQHDAGPVNWMSLRGAPSWWFGYKLTQSTTYLDPTAVRSRTASFAAGMTHRGGYHWLSSTTDPQQQAAWYLAKLGLLAVGEFAMLDAEEAGITAAGVLAWCEAVEAQTKRPAAVYTGAYVTGGTIWQSSKVREGKYGPRPMILAAYTTEAKARALPGVAAYPWSSWQYSSNGPVPGITGRCDENRVDDRPIYDRATGLGAPSTPHGDDMPAVFTNSEQYTFEGSSYPPGVVKWVVMPDGSKRHISGVEATVYGTPTGVPLSNDQIGQLPDYTAPAGSNVAAPAHFTGTVDLRAAT